MTILDVITNSLSYRNFVSEVGSELAKIYYSKIDKDSIFTKELTDRMDKELHELVKIFSIDLDSMVSQSIQKANLVSVYES